MCVVKKNYLKNIVVQKHHDDARYVETAERREYNEIAVVKHAQILFAGGRAVQAEYDRQPDGYRDHPDEHDGDADAFVVPVPGVFYGLRHRYISIFDTQHKTHTQIEYRRAFEKWLNVSIYKEWVYDCTQFIT